jgi:glycosyltransferase involved in cell wall biosynthesis
MPGVAIAYKNFAAANPKIRHIGLGVSATNTAKVLRENGIEAHVWPTESLDRIKKLIEMRPQITHIVINAPWISALEMSELCNDYPHLKICCNIHSNVAFLQADSNGVEFIRDYQKLEKGVLNFTLAANSKRYAEWQESTDNAPCQYLPNLYHLTHLDGSPRPPWQSEGVLRVGSFGAQRPLKNQLSAASAALTLANILRCFVVFSMNSERMEGGGQTVVRAIDTLYRGRPNAKVSYVGWKDWMDFRKVVAHQHLLIHPSYTESFSMVTAEGIAEGVPSVVTDAIDWAPDYWKAKSDDTMDLVQTAQALLHSRTAPADGMKALKTYNTLGIAAWKAWCM